MILYPDVECLKQVFQADETDRDDQFLLERTVRPWQVTIPVCPYFEDKIRLRKREPFDQLVKNYITDKITDGKGLFVPHLGVLLFPTFESAREINQTLGGTIACYEFEGKGAMCEKRGYRWKHRAFDSVDDATTHYLSNDGWIMRENELAARGKQWANIAAEVSQVARVLRDYESVRGSGFRNAVFAARQEVRDIAFEKKLDDCLALVAQLEAQEVARGASPDERIDAIEQAIMP